MTKIRPQILLVVICITLLAAAPPFIEWRAAIQISAIAEKSILSAISALSVLAGTLIRADGN